MTKVYLDSCIAIYLVEQTAYSHSVLQILNSFSNLILHSSNLALMECLVKPLRLGDTTLVRSYGKFFAGVNLVPSTQSVFRLAAEIRASCDLSAPDALHLAYASRVKCDVFLTNDAQIKAKWSAVGISQFPKQVIVI